jgi:ribosomal protein S25
MIKKIETDVKKSINEMSVLFPLLTLYTLAYLGLMIYAFVMKGAYTMPAGMMGIYVALIGAYAADKEIRRWVGKAEESKIGSVFVYAWLLFFLAAYMIQSFKAEYVLPPDLSLVALQVLGIFFGTKASKKFYEMKTSSKPEVILSREETVLESIKKNGKITRKELIVGLKLSRSSAGRLLAGMEDKGLIKQIGADSKDTYYVLPEGK